MSAVAQRKPTYRPKDIRSIREAAGLTLAAAAARVGVTRRAWSQYEAGDRVPSRSVEILIALLAAGKL